MSSNHVYKRGNKYVYRRRVPTQVQHLDNRKEVKISLKTDDYKVATLRAAIYDQQMEAFWISLIQSGNQTSFNARYQAAVKLAQAYGFAYKTTDQVAASSLEEIVERLSIDLDEKGKAEALLGGAGDSTLRLSDCSDLFWDLVPERLKNKSEHQVRKWKNPRKAAMTNFIEVIGDKCINQVSRNDILSFRGWWAERLRNGRSANTANKQIHFVKDMIHTVSLNNEIDVDTEALFVKTNFRDEKRSRPPFEASYVQNELLLRLHDLGVEDRMVIWAIADTGARVSEIFGLAPEDIRLDEEIPFIWIRAREGYSLKTKTSERQIPLVGSSLIAFKEFPMGFKNIGNPDSFSTSINKFLSKERLRPTPQHTIYSLRHTFKDRLRDSLAPEEIIDDLMGHKKSGPKYGRGHRIETKFQILKQIAYKV